MGRRDKDATANFCPASTIVDIVLSKLCNAVSQDHSTRRLSLKREGQHAAVVTLQ